MKLTPALAVFSLGVAAFSFATLAEMNMPMPATPATAPASAPATSTAPAAALIDVGNTKCAVTAEDVTKGLTVTYDGKIYHLCCPDCIKDFKKNPDKYIKAMNDNPAKYGLPKP